MPAPSWMAVMCFCAGHQQHAPHHLHRPDQGDDRHHHAGLDAALVEQRDQVEAHRREGEAVAREGHDQPPEGRHPHRRGQRALAGRSLFARLADRDRRLLRARHEQRVDQDSDAEIDDRKHDQRRPPVDAFDQQLREGNAESAGQPADERHHQDGLPEARPVDAGDHREGGLVERDRLAGAEAEPDDVEHRQRFDPRPGEHQDGRQQRAAGHQQPRHGRDRSKRRPGSSTGPPPAGRPTARRTSRCATSRAPFSIGTTNSGKV